MDMGEDEESIEAEEVFYSSMERGTRVHAGLSKLMLGEILKQDIEMTLMKRAIGFN